MARGNVEIVRKAVEAFSRRDIDDLIALVDPDVEFRSAFAALEGRVYRGHDGARQYVLDMHSSWDDWHTSEEGYHEGHDDTVVFTYRVQGRGKGSGVPIDERLAIVFTVRNGKIAAGAVHLDQVSAMSAAGIAG